MIRGRIVILAAIVSAMISCTAYNNSDEICALAPNASFMAEAEEISGNCGSMNMEIINTDSWGNVRMPYGMVCEYHKKTQCDINNTNCGYSVNGVNYLMSSHITIDDDGESATGYISVSASDLYGRGCSSTYHVEYNKL